MSSFSNRRRVRLAGLADTGSPGFQRAALLSLGTHAVVGVALFGGLAWIPGKNPAPDQPAEIEIVVGTNAHQTGSSAAAPPPADPATEQTPAEAPPDSPANAAPPLPPVEPDASAAVPAAPAASRPRASTVPQPATKPRTPAQPAPLTPARPQAASSQENIRLGDGIAATSAEIGRSNSMRPAERDTGNRAPAYPAAAARRHEHGTVVLRIFIAVDGSVSRVDVLHSSGFGTLDNAARDQILTWHFHPAVLNGLPVPDVEEQEITFMDE